MTNQYLITVTDDTPNDIFSEIVSFTENLRGKVKTEWYRNCESVLNEANLTRLFQEAEKGN